MTDQPLADAELCERWANAKPGEARTAIVGRTDMESLLHRAAGAFRAVNERDELRAKQIPEGAVMFVRTGEVRIARAGEWVHDRPHQAELEPHIIDQDEEGNGDGLEQVILRAIHGPAAIPVASPLT